jgi:hypothetical protein
MLTRHLGLLLRFLLLAVLASMDSVIATSNVIGGALGMRTVAGAPTAGTNEVQTLTIGGTPTGGTFKLSLRRRNQRRDHLERH